MFIESFQTSGNQILKNFPDLWNNATKFWKEMTMPIIGSMLNTFLQTASKYSPPGKNHHLGNAVIPEQMYYCRIINIDAAAKQKARGRKLVNFLNKHTFDGEAIPDELLEPRFRGKFVKRRWIKGDGRGKANRGGKKGYLAYQTDEKGKRVLVDVDSEVKNINKGDDKIPLYKEDYAALRAGKRFKIVSTRWKQKNKTLGYARTMPQAKKMARIINRGLAKYSWGTLLNSVSETQTLSEKPLIGANTSIIAHNTFQTLARKSPNVTRYNWGNINIDTSDIHNWSFKATAVYRMNTDQPYVPLAVKKGVAAAKQRWKAMMNAVWTKNKKSIERLMATQIRTVIYKYQ